MTTDDGSGSDRDSGGPSGRTEDEQTQEDTRVANTEVVSKKVPSIGRVLSTPDNPEYARCVHTATPAISLTQTHNKPTHLHIITQNPCPYFLVI